MMIVRQSPAIRAVQSSTEHAVQLCGIRKQYGKVTAVEEFSLDVDKGEFVSLLGPSGCGKTTTLRMVAGFVEPTAGEVFIGGRRVNDVPSYARNCGMVFQNYALFPHLSAFDNVAYGLRVRRLGKEEVKERACRAMEMVRMAGWETYYPRQLSGGQQQRIALARALVIEPSVLLLDEPLSNLDARLRVQMRDEIRTLVKSLGITTIFVTHDQEESLTMADRVVVMDYGKVEQVGSSADIYQRPETAFVATFVGTTNLVEDVQLLGGTSESDYALVTEDGTQLSGRTASGQAPCGKRLALSIRPERINIVPRPAGTGVDGPTSPDSLTGTVICRTYLGSTIRYRVAVSRSLEFLVDQQNRDIAQFDAGDPVLIWWDAKDGLIVSNDRR